MSSNFLLVSKLNFSLQVSNSKEHFTKLIDFILNIQILLIDFAKGSPL